MYEFINAILRGEVSHLKTLCADLNRRLRQSNTIADDYGRKLVVAHLQDAHNKGVFDRQRESLSRAMFANIEAQEDIAALKMAVNHNASVVDEIEKSLTAQYSGEIENAIQYAHSLEQELVNVKSEALRTQTQLGMLEDRTLGDDPSDVLLLNSQIMAESNRFLQDEIAALLVEKETAKEQLIFVTGERDSFAESLALSRASVQEITHSAIQTIWLMSYNRYGEVGTVCVEWHDHSTAVAQAFSEFMREMKRAKLPVFAVCTFVHEQISPRSTGKLQKDKLFAMIRAMMSA